MNRALQLVALIKELSEKRPKASLRVVELGAIRSLNPIYREGDGYSTLHIAHALRGTKHKATFVDLDCSPARQILLQEGLFDGPDRPDLHLAEEDAVHFAKRTKAIIDLLYIDTIIDPTHICELIKLLLPKMRPGGSYIVIDDIDHPAIRDEVIAFVRGYIEWSYVESNRQLIISVP